MAARVASLFPQRSSPLTDAIRRQWHAVIHSASRRLRLAAGSRAAEATDCARPGWRLPPREFADRALSFAAATTPLASAAFAVG